uniref:Uncharacterized protein n=2 Tax=Acrobeloides nanus TaxID=290746 RepID=A0A914DK67_9BILA
MEQCLDALERNGLSTFPVVDDGSLWCNATWDTVLCWPATPANSSISLQCPPLKGLDPTKNITKFCHASGRWMGKSENDFSKEHGWTNFTMCFTEEVTKIMENLNNETLVMAQAIARNARRVEFIGLGLSLLTLTLSILIFSSFRRLRVFRNQLHLQLMIAILMVVIIRLVLYIDLIFTDKLGGVHANQEGRTINTMRIVCEMMFFLLEYFKSVAFWWTFLEGFYLYNQLVLTVFNTEPKLKLYLLAGYGIPLLHTCLWLGIIFYKKAGKVERCLGSYYLEPEFWILDGPRMLQLVVNTFFVCNVVRVLYSKVRDSHNTSEIDKMKKSVKAVLMLIILLGLPNIMQTIPFSPNKENIMYFAIWTYCASFTYMYQGLIIAIIYCFTNREVQSVLKSCYSRYKLQHSNSLDLRRGSRSIVSYYQTKNGTLTTAFDANGNAKMSVDESSNTKLLLPNNQYDPAIRNNSTASESHFSFCSANENTPLRPKCRDEVDFNNMINAKKKPSVTVTFVDDAG